MPRNRTHYNGNVRHFTVPFRLIYFDAVRCAVGASSSLERQGAGEVESGRRARGKERGREGGDGGRESGMGRER